MTSRGSVMHTQVQIPFNYAGRHKIHCIKTRLADALLTYTDLLIACLTFFGGLSVELLYNYKFVLLLTGSTQ